MHQKLTRQGDDLVLKLDPKLLASAGIDEMTPLEVTAEENGLKVARAPTPVEEVSDAQFKATVEKMHEKWGSVFKKLAE